jgi:hypothetical protein
LVQVLDLASEFREQIVDSRVGGQFYYGAFDILVLASYTDEDFALGFALFLIIESLVNLRRSFLGCQ